MGGVPNLKHRSRILMPSNRNLTIGQFEQEVLSVEKTQRQRFTSILAAILRSSRRTDRVTPFGYCRLVLEI